MQTLRPQVRSLTPARRRLAVRAWASLQNTHPERPAPRDQREHGDTVSEPLQLKKNYEPRIKKKKKDIKFYIIFFLFVLTHSSAKKWSLFIKPRGFIWHANKEYLKKKVFSSLRPMFVCWTVNNKLNNSVVVTRQQPVASARTGRGRSLSARAETHADMYTPCCRGEYESSAGLLWPTREKEHRNLL